MNAFCKYKAVALKMYLNFGTNNLMGFIITL
jgi:hypothetical protein